MDAGEKKKRLLKKIICLLVLFFFVIMPAANAAGYECAFRFVFTDLDRDAELPVSGGYRLSEYDFETEKGKRLHGYLLTAEDADPSEYRKIQIFSHGIRAGASDYAPLLREFAAPDMPLFYYDALGCGKSEGPSSGGLPEGVRDLDAAIAFIRTFPEFTELPLRLVGHSWGAYAAGSVLEFHPEIEEAWLYAGFNTSSDMLEEEASRYAGPLTAFLLPYVRIHEQLKFGKYANASIVRGVRASRANVVVIQGLKDTRVDPDRYGILYLERELRDAENVRFIELPEAGHLFELKAPEDY